MAPNTRHHFGVVFKGTYLPQNRVLAPHLETERNPFQKHMHSFLLLELLPLSMNSPLDQ